MKRFAQSEWMHRFGKSEGRRIKAQNGWLSQVYQESSFEQDCYVWLCACVQQTTKHYVQAS